MSDIKLNIDKNLILEANKVLDLLGMNLDVAVEILLKRILIEKAFPIPLVLNEEIDFEIIDKDLSEELNKEPSNNRKYKTINKEMVDEVWNCFLRSRDTNEDTSVLSREIANKTGMNSRSAFIYLNILSNLVKGRKNTRNMKLSDLEYYISKIKNELGNDEYLNALESLKLSIPHWSQIYLGGFASGVEQILDKYSKDNIKIINKDEIKKEVVISLDSFRIWLEKQGYKRITTGGNPSTSYIYSKKNIPFVLNEERIALRELAENINYYIKDYDTGGIKEHLGGKSNRSVINALKRFKEYIDGKESNKNTEKNKEYDFNLDWE